METDAPIKSMESYSVLGLYVAGMRFSDWSREDAVEEYVRLHPDAVESEVRAELDREMARELAEQ